MILESERGVLESCDWWDRWMLGEFPRSYSSETQPRVDAAFWSACREHESIPGGAVPMHEPELARYLARLTGESE
jgi:hypothetical protein